jgi:hypothetical protein
MWVLAPTDMDAYLITGQAADRPTMAVTHDAGKTWSITSFEAATSAQGEDLTWDPVRQIVVQAAYDTGQWGVRTFDKDGKFLGFQESSLRGITNLAVDPAGTWWTLTCDGTSPCEPRIAKSVDQGNSWDTAALPYEGGDFQLPYVATGRANEVAVVWYEADKPSPTDLPLPTDSSDQAWRYVAVRTAEGSAWTRTVLTPEPVRVGTMCASAACLGEARFAGDFSGLWIDSQGIVHASWNHQIGPKTLPTSQVSASTWDVVEYARTTGPTSRAS